MRIAYVGLLAGVLACAAARADIESVGGDVTFRGRLVAQPCVIVTDSIEVVMDPLSARELEQHGGKGPPKAFNIELTQCSTSVLSSVVVLFEGKQDAVLNGRLETTGKAKGIALRLLNGKDGSVIDINQPAKALALQPGDNQLPFAVYVEAQKERPVEGGDFAANANFKLSYQ
ncbi:Fimbrial adapter papK precursor [Serratia ficaria]|nr:Fimbrial adapter papK precursor [Serratia ficaria]